MNLLSLFQSKQTRTQQTQLEANRKRRYEYGVQEVQRWTQAKKEWIKTETQLFQEIEEKIADLDRRAGPDSGVSEGLRQYLADRQDQLERDLQEADYRLAFYRNIVLMQGRV